MDNTDSLNRGFCEIRSLTLPTIDDKTPSRLHTIVQDDRGNLYYSDEFNYSIVSLNKDGALRWHRSGKGSAPGQFWYPRGLALGTIAIANEAMPCLAVCDSWNRRVQLFDLDGNYRSEWKEAGAQPFAEPVDVRFVSGSSDAEPYWLVLDRGNHRLCAFRQDGKFLHQIGKAIPPSLERQWIQPILEILNGPPSWDDMHESPVFDPIYYPSALFGHSERALFLYEPMSRCLKQVFMGSLFPISLPSPGMSEWIAADECGLLSWDSRFHKLVYFDGAGDPVSTATINGYPVHSAQRSYAAWIQANQQLFFLACENTPSVNSEPGPHISLLVRTAQFETAEALQNGELPDALNDFLKPYADLRALSDFLIELVAGNKLDLQAVKSVQEKMASIDLRMDLAASKLHKSAERLVSAQAKLCLACGSKGIEQDASPHIRDLRNDLAETVSLTFKELQDRFDATYILRWSLPQPISGKQDGWDLVRKALSQQENDLSNSLKKLQLWTLPIQNLSAFKVTAEGQPICRPAASAKGRSKYLREIDRVFVGETGAQPPSRPYGLAANSSGEIFATVNRDQSLWHFDRSGKSLGRLGEVESVEKPFNQPACISIDDQNRLWITDFGNHSIHIYDQNEPAPKLVPRPDPGPDALHLPIGICRGPLGSMIVSEYGHHRIRAFAENGDWDLICDRFGKGLGELRHPIMISEAGNAQGTFWVVDQLNHRIQRFDSSGNPLQSIGSMGVGKGCLLMPECITHLSDDTIAVSQWRFNSELKLFSTDGLELDCLQVDYSPAGLLFQQGLLYVADWSGSHIRVYEFC